MFLIVVYNKSIDISYYLDYLAIQAMKMQYCDILEASDWTNWKIILMIGTIISPPPSPAAMANAISSAKVRSPK